jgi:hypothetical protein
MLPVAPQPAGQNDEKVPLRMSTTHMAGKLRRLAAIEILFLGYVFVVAEYAIGSFGSVFLGLFVLIRGHSPWQVALGMYLICLGINYLPMLRFAVAVRNKQNAQSDLRDEVPEKKSSMTKYRRLSLLLLVPLLVPIFGLSQMRTRPPGSL